MSTTFNQTSLQPHDSAPPITLALTIILLVFLFIGFFSIYICRCLMDLLRSRNLRRTPSGNLAGASSSSDNGLLPSLITSFPTFPYSSIKTFRKHNKYSLECAICLLEFEDESFLRLLTGCCHVFHQDCIDLWLQSHKTCPVCRRNLDSSSAAERNETEDVDRESSLEDAIVIDVEESVEVSNNNVSSSPCKKSEEAVEKFSRSHSTGHSLVRVKEEDEEDKYTLRLPEDVKKTIIRGHNWTGSCVTFEELSRSSANGAGFLQVSGSDQTKDHR